MPQPLCVPNVSYGSEQVLAMKQSTSRNILERPFGAKARHAHLYAIAAAALPHFAGGYIQKCMGFPAPEEFAGLRAIV